MGIFLSKAPANLLQAGPRLYFWLAFSGDLRNKTPVTEFNKDKQDKKNRAIMDLNIPCKLYGSDKKFKKKKV